MNKIKSTQFQKGQSENPAGRPKGSKNKLSEDFLQELNKDLSKKLSKHIKYDKTNPYINDIVAKRWRIKMAINTIRNYGEKEIAA